jgi:ABC-type nitrate/sulfonate/bicarbonate transport system substrate-binding protein
MFTRRRKFRWTPSLVITALAFVALAGGAPTSEAASNLTSVTIGVGADPSFAPWIIGAEKGFFAKHGVDAKIQYFQGGSLANDAMVAGQIQFSGSGAGTVLPRIATKKVATIARTATSGTTFSIVARKDMTSPRDFIGKKLGTVPGTTMEYVWGLFLKKNHISPSQVETVAAQPAELTTSLVQGRLDAMLMFQPWPYKATQLSSNLRIYQYSRDIGYVLHFHATGNVAWMAAHPAATENVLRGLKDAINFINQNRAETVSVLSEAMHQPADVTARQTADYDFQLAMPTKAMVQNMHNEAKWLASQHKLNSRIFPWKTAFATQYLATVLDTKPVSAVLPKRQKRK